MPTNKLFSRERQLQCLAENQVFDLVVIGGGATGAGVALDAASRGYRVALCEQHDFGKGTSSRSTKLIHGGVRYLQQGNIGLVRDALRERQLLIKNASHLVHPQAFVLPVYGRWESFYYGVGLKAYDLLSGDKNLGQSVRLSRQETLSELPTLSTHALRGGIRYFDAAFDDARLLINLLQTAIEHGAVCLNYLKVTDLLRSAGRLVGVCARDVESEDRFEIRAKAIINATGPFTDQISHLDNSDSSTRITPSQGIHLVLEQKCLPSTSALIIPKTSDGRVVFAIPWYGHTLIGTTDTLVDKSSLEPVALPEEIDFLIDTIANYLTTRPKRADVLSVFAGLRPLIKNTGKRTAKLSRDHQVRVSDSGLVSIMGGKWTTYRKMAVDCVDRAEEVADLKLVKSKTASLPIHGALKLESVDRLSIYGTDREDLQQLIQKDGSYSEQLDHDLPYTVGEVVWACRHEFARTVEDVLARRLRALMLNAQCAIRSAPRVAKILATELKRDENWAQRELDNFQVTSQHYLPNSS